MNSKRKSRRQFSEDWRQEVFGILLLAGFLFSLTGGIAANDLEAVAISAEGPLFQAVRTLIVP
ncbi:MAG: hypothetical protein IPK50_08745 [Fibrobacterota bacterium]|nr:hypothetical protein [Fibrobacterota bacterium]QQS06969.1 MAG: hypothetical protein IPK50_08745 [Fibrobacterota bacterium]